MEFLKNRTILFKLIVALCIVLVVINFGMSNIAKAVDGSDVAAQGGKLLQPVVDLLLTLGDGIMDILQKAILGNKGNVVLDIGAKGWISVALGIVAAIATIVVITVATLGIGAVVARNRRRYWLSVDSNRDFWCCFIYNSRGNYSRSVRSI